jgi:predicted nucleotide-binding protein (sugar kinase/HSP70/actin superfamily)
MGCSVDELQRQTVICRGCENTCAVTCLKQTSQKPGEGRMFYSGNKCETVFTNMGDRTTKGFNHMTFGYDLLFNRFLPSPHAPVCRIGIPRVLNMFESYPFFSTLLTESGFEVVLSSPSHMALYRQGAGSIMSDSICFPAKLVHGHIQDLIHQNVDRIFYPMVVYERLEGDEKNSYNCPIVSGYPDVIDSAVNPWLTHGIPLDKPPVTFKNLRLLKKNCLDYLKPFNIAKNRFERAFQKALAVQSDVMGAIKEKAMAIIRVNESAGKKMILLLGRPYHYDPLINHKLPDMICDYGMDVVSSNLMVSEPGLDAMGDAQVFTQWAYTNRLYQAVHLAERYDCVEVVCINSFGCGPDAIAVDEVRDMLRAIGKNLTVIRVDEMVSTNSIRLRIRTLVEMMKQKTGSITFAPHERKTTTPFRSEDKQKELLLPMISRFHAPFVQDVVSGFGYRAVILPDTDRESRDLGLKFTNNEMCYPAILIIGDVLKALISGTSDPRNSVVGLFQTGGQCRLSSYLSLIKKALVDAGYDYVPVIPIVVSVNGAHHKLLKHPVFKLNTMKLIENGFYYMLYCDVLSRMYYSTVTREKNKGESLALITRYIERGVTEKIKENKGQSLRLLQQAIHEFNALDIHPATSYPKIGVVGEIYVKYNPFSNRNIMDWLIERGMEIDIPPLMYTVFQMLANKRINRNLHLTPSDSFWILSPLFEYRAEQLVRQVDRLYQSFRFYKPFHSINHLKHTAAEIMSLSSQFGEGWMIAAEILSYAREGITTVLCLQPFGCIANQVIAKGLEKRIKDMHPDMNILYIDLDFDTSDVNLYNRLHFLIQHAMDRSVDSSNQDPVKMVL